MAWTTPATSPYGVGQVLGAAQVNAISNNLRYLKGLDGDITLDDDLLLGTKTLQFGTTQLYRAIASALESLHVQDTAAIIKASLYLGGGSANTYNPAVAILPAGTVLFSAASIVHVYNVSTNVTSLQFPSGNKGAAASNIDPATSRLSWQCTSGGAVQIARTAGTDSWAVAALTFYY